MSGSDLSHFSMLDLFRMEVEEQRGALTAGLLALERDPAAQGPDAVTRLEALMRSAHSLKGAARMVGYESAVRVAHVMEDAFVDAQAGRRVLDASHIDVLLQGVDLFGRLAAASDSAVTQDRATHDAWADAFVASLAALTESGSADEQVPSPLVAEHSGDVSSAAAAPQSDMSTAEPSSPDLSHTDEPTTALHTATVRVGADHLSRLLGLAGESLVTSRWIGTFMQELQRLKRLQSEHGRLLAAVREHVATTQDQQLSELLHATAGYSTRARDLLMHCMTELDAFDRRSLAVSHRLYNEVLASRMRPFADAVQGLPRMARDIARTLDKHVELAIIGETTPVDRDILQRLEAPLVHIVRNALDHGVEIPDARHAAGKATAGRITVEARHSAGRLVVTVGDDGSGVSCEAIRDAVIERHLAPPHVAQQLTDAELLEFLFLPGFSTKQDVTEISGRGVGLDAVRVFAREVGGTVELSSEPGQGTRVHLQLPLTLSVVRALLVEVGGEPYAIPLARVARVLKVPREAVHSVEGREHILLDEQHPIGLVPAHDVFGVPGLGTTGEALSIVVVGERTSRYGCVIDRFLGERELVVRELDPRLGKVRDISAAAVLPDGTPVLIVDVDDLVRSIDLLVSGGRLASVGVRAVEAPSMRRRRILVVDDSITVRETERKLLESVGYEVDVAIDGMDAWNAARSGSYDLIVTDVDMPRLDGVELTKLVRNDPRLKSVPVMIVSYKDREEDRLRGLDAGADYYLTKASFHDDTLLRAAADLIGEAYA